MSREQEIKKQLFQGLIQSHSQLDNALLILSSASLAFSTIFLKLFFPTALYSMLSLYTCFVLSIIFCIGSFHTSIACCERAYDGDEENAKKYNTWTKRFNIASTLSFIAGIVILLIVVITIGS